MKKREFLDLKSKSDKELVNLVKDLKKETTKLKLEVSLRKLKNVSLISQKRKDIARLLTILKERKLNG